jgi:hypothetical protein
MVPEWMALRPQDVVAPPSAPLGLPGPTVSAPRTQQFGPGSRADIQFRGTPRDVGDVTPGGTAVVEDVMASPVQGTEIDFSSPVDGESMSMSIPSRFTFANDIATGRSPGSQRFTGDVTSAGRQPSAIELDGNAPFGWPGADARLGVTRDVNPTAGMGDIYEVTPEPGGAAFRSDDPALTTMGDLSTLDDIALDGAQLDDLIPELERTATVADEVAKAAPDAAPVDAPVRSVPEEEIDFVEDTSRPRGPWSPRPASEQFGWRRADGGAGRTQRLAQAASRNAYRTGALGLTGLGAGVYALLNGEPGAEPSFAAFDPVTPTPAGPQVLPGPRTDPTPMERVEGAPQAEIANEDLAPAAPVEEPVPAEASPEPRVTGPELTGVERAQQAARAREMLARGAMTREEIMANELFSRLPSAHLASVLKAGEDQRARRERVKLAGIFSGGGRTPWGAATQEAAAFEALPAAEQQVYLQQRLLRPGQMDSPTIKAMRDRIAMQAAREEADAGRQSNENVARINAEGGVEQERARADGAVRTAETGKEERLSMIRQNIARIDADIAQSRLAEDQAQRNFQEKMAADERRHRENLQAQRDELTVAMEKIAAEKAERRTPEETIDLQSLEENRKTLVESASRSFRTGKTRRQAAEAIMLAAPGATPGAIKLILDKYQWPG